ncbi:MAG: DivIVA domain-containing protein [Acidimicrobiia bacterium]|nr:DivIVA domain-containing protein [Acidimicrobiia bacterium]
MSGKELTTEFPLVEKGYDPGVVDQYVATQLLQLREQLEAATARVVELEDELEAAKKREDAIQLTMMVATKARDELLENAKADADEIVADARRVAFAMMTESRNDVDRAMSESKVMVDVARTEALSVVSDAEEETKRLVAEREAVLAKLQADYEAESAVLIDRINTLRSIADDLTSRAATSPQPETTSPDPPPPNEGRTADAPHAEDVPDREDDDDSLVADRIRGSFSGRRSAKLPRLGEEAGRSALAAATAMRAHLNHEPDESAPADDDDLAVRTA